MPNSKKTVKSVQKEKPAEVVNSEIVTDPTTVTTQQATTTNQKDTIAIIALVISILTLCAWFLPICGIPTSLIAIGLGIYAFNAPKNKTIAIIAIVLSSIGLIASICNSIAGAAIMLGNSNL